MTNQNFIDLSRIYEESEKVKVSLQGKKLDKMRSQALENPEQFWGEQAKNLIWFKQWDKV
jgi:acetyl-CoA synthetase